MLVWTWMRGVGKVGLSFVFQNSSSNELDAERCPEFRKKGLKYLP